MVNIYKEKMLNRKINMKILVTEGQLEKINEMMGNSFISSNRRTMGQRWHNERSNLKNYLINYGETMVSRENGKEYKVIYDPFISNRLGMNYCLCVQWDSLTTDAGEIIYVRAYDKFSPIG